MSKRNGKKPQQAKQTCRAAAAAPLPGAMHEKVAHGPLRRIRIIEPVNITHLALSGGGKNERNTKTGPRPQPRTYLERRASNVRHHDMASLCHKRTAPPAWVQTRRRGVGTPQAAPLPPLGPRAAARSPAVLPHTLLHAAGARGRGALVGGPARTRPAIDENAPQRPWAMQATPQPTPRGKRVTTRL